MIHERRSWRPVLRVLVLAAAVAAAPLPALAGEHSTESATPGIKASAQKAVATMKPVSAPRMAQSQGGSPQTDLGSPSFFKSPAGIITLVAIGVGAGFAIYSTSNDRVSSPKVDYGNGGR